MQQINYVAWIQAIWNHLGNHKPPQVTTPLSSVEGEKNTKPNKKHTMHMHLLASGTGVPSCQGPYKEAVLALNGLHILTLDNWKYQVLNWILSQSAKYEASRPVPHKGSTPSSPCFIFSTPWLVSSHLSTSSPNILVHHMKCSPNQHIKHPICKKELYRRKRPSSDNRMKLTHKIFKNLPKSMLHLYLSGALSCYCNNLSSLVAGKWTDSIPIFMIL